MQEIRIYARQGDLLIDPVENPPLPLEETTSVTTIKGSHEGAHTLPSGVLYGQLRNEQYVTPQNDVELRHGGRHEPVPLRAGVTYRIWSQIERHGAGDQEVED